ncbi:MAG: glutamate racemase [Burkholderiales bacterium]|nr:glutamate racemase [Burkholderiales bacterium]
MPSTPASATALRVGVFDSGVGGLSVLRAIHETLPQATLIYAADSAHAPYGERSDDDILRRSEAMAAFLHAAGADVLVVACNTATAIAIEPLRLHHAGWPIVGVEPGIKPAIAASRNGRIGVMATTGTLRSARYQRLLQAHGARVQVFAQPCPGLAHAIEQGRLDDPELLALIERHCAPLRAHGVDTVVLGCTHYPFVARQIQAALGPEVLLLDTAHAVARQVARVVEGLQPHVSAPGTLPQLWTNGDPQQMQRLAGQWLGFPFLVQRLPA